MLDMRIRSAALALLLAGLLASNALVAIPYAHAGSPGVDVDEEGASGDKDPGDDLDEVES